MESSEELGLTASPSWHRGGNDVADRSTYRACRRSRYRGHRTVGNAVLPGGQYREEARTYTSLRIASRRLLILPRFSYR